MPVDSNRYQIFYCPPVVLPPQVQRPVPRQQSYNQELQSAVCSSSHRPQPHPPPQPSSLLPIKLSTTSPIEAKVTSSSSSSSGSFKGSDKTIKISITRKKLKVTRGNGGGCGGRNEVDLVTSILKPGRETNGAGKLKRVRIRTQVQPITSIFKVKSPLSPPNLKKPIESTSEAHVVPIITISPSTLPSPPVDKKNFESCSYCENYFNNETLNDHMMISHYGTKMSGIFTCSLCETVHRDYADYASHYSNTHSIYSDGITPEDPFVMITQVTKLPRQCNICNITLNSTKEMKDHFTVHQDSSSAYQCRLCRKLISTLTLLKKHLESIHFVKFKCPPLPPPPPPPSTLQQPLQLLSSTSSTSTSSTLTNGSQCSTFTAH